MKAKISRPANVQSVFNVLSSLYPNADTELTYDGPFQLLVSVILSAQCTDARVNMTTPTLFALYPDAPSLAQAKLTDVEKIIHSCGFYRAKAKAITEAARDIVSRFGGEVPGTLEELITLRGVGRKTASVVLNQAFDVPAIAVDTHVKRVAFRLGWTENTDPVKIEFDLRKRLPENLWATVNGLLILHGRRLCKAAKPLCSRCEIAKFCPKKGVKLSA